MYSYKIRTVFSVKEALVVLAGILWMDLRMPPWRAPSAHELFQGQPTSHAAGARHGKWHTRNTMLNEFVPL